MTIDAEAATVSSGLAERERVMRVLRRHETEIRARGVTRLALFGATARGETEPPSDVDLLIEVDPDATFTLIDLAGLERLLAGLLGRPVEFASPSRLREGPRVWRRVPGRTPWTCSDAVHGPAWKRSAVGTHGA